MVNIDFPVIIFCHAEMQCSISLYVYNDNKSGLIDKYCIVICICV